MPLCLAFLFTHSFRLFFLSLFRECYAPPSIFSTRKLHVNGSHRHPDWRRLLVSDNSIWSWRWLACIFHPSYDQSLLGRGQCKVQFHRAPPPSTPGTKQNCSNSLGHPSQGAILPIAMVLLLVQYCIRCQYLTITLRSRSEMDGSSEPGGSCCNADGESRWHACPEIIMLRGASECSL